MKLLLVNCTGISLFLKFDKKMYKLNCGSERILEIDPNSAKYTRFVAKYKSERPETRGLINVLLDSNRDYQTLVLRAIIDGNVQAIGCLTINDSGNYVYSVISDNKLTQRYPELQYYNISVPIDRSKWAKFKEAIGINFSTGYCENRDSLACDKFIGVPMYIWMIILIIVIVIVLIGLMADCLITHKLFE